MTSAPEDVEKEIDLQERLDIFTPQKHKIVRANAKKTSGNKSEESSDNIDKWPLTRSWFFESIVNYYSLDMCYVFKTQLSEKRLEQALAQTLTYYPALAGRIHYGGLYEEQYVDMSNEGVELITCRQPNVGYQDLVGNDVNQEETLKRGRYCDIRNGETIVNGESPLLTMRLTLLDNGGCVLGVCISHSIVDGGAFALFMQDFSNVYHDLKADISPLLEPSELYSRMESSHDEIVQAAEVMKYTRSSILKSAVMRYIYSWAFYFLRKQKASNPSHCPPRFCLKFSKEELLFIKRKGTEEARKSNPENWVSTNEALMVHFWTMLLDVCELPDEQRKDLGINLIVNPRGRTKLCPKRVLGSVGFGVHYALDMSSTAPVNKYVQAHEFCRWAVSDDVASASVCMLESAMSRNRFDPIYVNSRTSSELPYGLSRWNINPQTLQEGNTFGLPMEELVGVQSWNTGEVYKVVMRPDGGCDAYINMSRNPIMGNMVSNWPLVRSIGPTVFFDKFSAHHEAWRAKIKGI